MVIILRAATKKLRRSYLWAGGVLYLTFPGICIWGLLSSGSACECPRSDAGRSEPKTWHRANPMEPINRMIRPMLPPFPPLFWQDFGVTGGSTSEVPSKYFKLSSSPQFFGVAFFGLSRNGRFSTRQPPQNPGVVCGFFAL